METGSSCWGFPPLMYSPSFFSYRIRNLAELGAHPLALSHIKAVLETPSTPSLPPPNDWRGLSAETDGKDGEKGLAEAMQRQYDANAT